MRRDERLRAILDMLAGGEGVEVADLQTRLGVSPATARRDLDVLAQRRLLTRTRGGATARALPYDLPVRSTSTSSAQAAIATLAQQLIAPGASIGLSGGSTARAVASALGQREDLVTHDSEGVTVVTSALDIATELAMRPHVRVVVTGGVLRPRSYELVGPLGDTILQQLTLDVALIGVTGLEVCEGPTVTDEREACTNALMASRAKRSWVVAASHKLGARSFARVGEPGLFTGLVTDSGADPAHVAELEDAGWQVLLAQV